MSRQKGNALCHTYTNIGRHNHEQITWKSNKLLKCQHHRNIGKRGICLLNKKIDCKAGDIETCQHNIYLHRKCVYLNCEGAVACCGFDNDHRVCHQLYIDPLVFVCPIGKYTVAPE